MNVVLAVVMALSAPAPFPKTVHPHHFSGGDVGGKGWAIKADGEHQGFYHIYLGDKGEYTCGGWRGKWWVANRRTLYVTSFYTLDSRNRYESFEVDLPSMRGVFLQGEEKGKKFTMSRFKGE
jgi:hypothetical protein